MERDLRGAILVGGPQEVIDKILYQYDLFRHQRHLIQLTVGPMPHADVMRAIELLGSEVAPVVRREVASRQKKREADQRAELEELASGLGEESQEGSP